MIHTVWVACGYVEISGLAWRASRPSRQPRLGIWHLCRVVGGSTTHGRASAMYGMRPHTGVVFLVGWRGTATAILQLLPCLR